MTKANCKSSLEITIAIPLYKNDNRSLLCIASAVSQDKSVNKVILSDDGENQKFGEFACQLDSRVEYIKNENNLGMWRNYVECYKRSSTRYFAWLDEDDYISPSYAQTISKAINKQPNHAAWVGLPNTHSSTRGTELNAINIQKSSSNPYSRFLDVFSFGNCGAFFYAVIDKEKVSISPLERLLEWPYWQYSYDYIWMIHVAIQGKLSQMESMIYFYDISNWNNSDEISLSNTNSKQITVTERLSVPLTYLAGTLLSFQSYLKRSSNGKSDSYIYNNKALLSGWKKILTFLCSNYLIASLTKTERSLIRVHEPLKDVILKIAEFTDNFEKRGPLAIEFWNKLIDELSEYQTLKLILETKCSNYNYPVYRILSEPHIKTRKLLRPAYKYASDILNSLKRVKLT